MDKVFIKPGDVVTLRQKMKAPNMLVIRKESSLFKDSQKLKGFRCRWFTDSGLMQEAIFNTMDLILVE